MTILSGGIFVGLRRLRQVVTLAVLKPAFAPVLAVLFGLVQLICACAAPMEANATDHAAMAPITVVAAYHAPMPDMDMPSHCDDGTDAPSDQDHNADCAHCGDAQITAVADAFSPTPALDLSLHAALEPPKAAQLRPAPRALAPERYRRRADPPRSTPVTLKLRLTV